MGSKAESGTNARQEGIPEVWVHAHTCTFPSARLLQFDTVARNMQDSVELNVINALPSMCACLCHCLVAAPLLTEAAVLM